jgi:hypothetical protein
MKDLLNSFKVISWSFFFAFLIVFCVSGFVDINGVRDSVDKSVIYYHPTVKLDTLDCNEMVWGGDRGSEKFCGNLIKVRLKFTGTDTSLYFKIYIDPWEKGETQTVNLYNVFTSPALTSVIGSYDYVIPSSDASGNVFGGYYGAGDLYFAVTDSNSTLTPDFKAWVITK